MTFRNLLTFDLRAEFPTDCGWLSAVRSRCLDAAAATYLRRCHPGLLHICDAERIIADWRPIRAQMFYYLRLKHCVPCQFIATDGVFVHTVDADGADWRSFKGPVERLLVRCYSLWKSGPVVGNFPLAPGSAGYPAAIIVHHLGSESATIASVLDPSKSQHLEDTQCLLNK